jgi:toxin ParE1/3/4
MSLAVNKSAAFLADFSNQFAWYFSEAGEDLAWRFEDALDATLTSLTRQPEIGRMQHFQNPLLQGLRSTPLASPFGKLLVFYRVQGRVLEIVRLMHGARDLPRRLAEPPEIF